MDQIQDAKVPDIGVTIRVTSKVSPDPGQRRHLPGIGGANIVSVARRAIVAMRSDESGLLSLVMDDLAPVPLGRDKFLVAPMFNSVGVEVKECEAAPSDVMPLLTFEQDDHAAEDIAVVTTKNVSGLVQKYKGYGDQMLRLSDYTSAISYYEAALSFVSSKIGKIGGTLVVRRKGHSVIAEVDCVENDEKNNPLYDVTYLSGEEAQVSQKAVLLAVWTRDVSFLQTRVLLNLSRCLLKLADVDTTRGNASCVGENIASAKNSRQERYRLAAVLGCSISLALCEYHALESSTGSAADLDSLVEKARIVRSRAFLGLRKLPNAKGDAKKAQTNREAQVLLSEIKAIEAYNKSVDKKLAKEVCLWVETATNDSSSNENGAEAGEKNDSVSSVCENETETKKGCHVQDTKDDLILRWVKGVSTEIIGMVAFLVAMWVVYPANVQEL
ncbi:hypothetical protein ACHAXR_010583 [Thalassiosira sp. AJA248-18]